VELRGLAEAGRSPTQRQALAYIDKIEATKTVAAESWTPNTK